MRYQKLFIQGGRPTRRAVEVGNPEVDFLIIQTRFSFVSMGTERQTLTAQASSFLSRVLAKPEVSLGKIYNTLVERGFFGTVDLINFSSSRMLSVGYSASGTVLAAAADSGFFVGQSVACSGAGVASHGELIFAPKSMVVPMPQDADLAQCSASGVLAIALQAFHRSGLGLGQNLLVVGCGLLGNFVIQLAKFGGVRVYGLDSSPEKEVDSLVAGCEQFFVNTNETNARALAAWARIDAVIVTTALSDSSVVDFCTAAVRPGAKIVIVGDGDIRFAREAFYKKELSILASCSTGPGRNNQGYWTETQDWPEEHVRWSARRNLALAADLLARSKVVLPKCRDLDFQAQDFERLYQEALKTSSSPILISYNSNFEGALEHGWQENSILAARRSRQARISKPFYTAFVGLGAFARGTLLAIVQMQPDVKITAIVDSDDQTLLTVGAMLGLEECHSTIEPILSNPSITVAIVATPHNVHATQVLALLERGVAVFVEKPLAITRQELEKVTTFIDGAPDAILMVDFNRSSSAYGQFATSVFKNRLTPLVINYRVNALVLSDAHWVWRAGGRIVGELCHMVEFLMAIVDNRPTAVAVTSTGLDTGLGRQNLFVSIQFADGSVGNICYTSLGNSGLPKERVECFWEGRTLVIDDFCQAEGFGLEGQRMPSGQDKGHSSLINEFFRQVRELDFQANEKFLSRAIMATEICFVVQELVLEGGGFRCVQ